MDLRWPTYLRMNLPVPSKRKIDLPFEPGGASRDQDLDPDIVEEDEVDLVEVDTNDVENVEGVSFPDSEPSREFQEGVGSGAIQRSGTSAQRNRGPGPNVGVRSSSRSAALSNKGDSSGRGQLW